METNGGETDLNDFLLTVGSPGVEDVEGDVEFPSELGRGSLAQQTLHNLFGFYPGLADTNEGLKVRHAGGKPGDEEDRVAEPQVGLPGRLQG